MLFIHTLKEGFPDKIQGMISKLLYLIPNLGGGGRGMLHKNPFEKQNKQNSKLGNSDCDQR